MQILAPALQKFNLVRFQNRNLTFGLSFNILDLAEEMNDISYMLSLKFDLKIKCNAK